MVDLDEEGRDDQGRRHYYTVPSFTNPDKGYKVERDETTGLWSCNCPDTTYRHNPECKHKIALEEEGLLW